MSNRDNAKVTVYGLASSEDLRLRYVGQTTGRLDRRLIHHHYDAKKLSLIHKSNWIRSVTKRGHTVVIFAIEENAPWGTAEIKWIKHYRDLGFDLVNTTDGGEGVVGYERTPEQRAALSARMMGRPSPRKGVTLSAETRAKISEVQRGRVISEECRAKISAALKGRKKSPEHIAKVAAALTKPPKPEPTAEEIAKRRADLSARLSAQRKGRVLREEHKEKIAAGLARAYANGRRGALAKLTDDEVREIRTLLTQRAFTQAAIAQMYGISQGALSEIKTGKTYKHVT